MRYLTTILVLLLAGCTDPLYVETNEPAVLRDFQRACMAKEGQYITLQERRRVTSREARSWRMECRYFELLEDDDG